MWSYNTIKHVYQIITLTIANLSKLSLLEYIQMDYLIGSVEMRL